jgi:hypothetical protein
MRKGQLLNPNNRSWYFQSRQSRTFGKGTESNPPYVNGQSDRTQGRAALEGIGANRHNTVWQPNRGERVTERKCIPRDNSQFARDLYSHQ